MTDPIVVAAQFLAGQVEYARHQPWFPDFVADVEQCARVVQGMARGPSEQKYLGPCGAELELCGFGQPDHDNEWRYCDRKINHEDAHRFEDADIGHIRTCDGDVYAPRGGSNGRCRTCGAEVASGDREAWLDGEVRGWAFTAREIADAYGIPVKTIRSWATDRTEARDHDGRILRSATPAKLRSYWRTEAGIVADWAEPPEDETRERLHYVGDVLDLAAADAARRETNRATRERRQAAKAAESEEAA